MSISNLSLCRAALLASLILFVIGVPNASSSESSPTGYQKEVDIPYYDEETQAKTNSYQQSQCRLDFYYPSDQPGFPTIIWFHGGGLTAGKRAFPNLMGRGFALVAVSYRLSPQADFPAFLEDAAAATAWVLKEVKSKGGDPRKVFVAGHSAGAYLACMIGMDPRWLTPYGVSNKQLAGIISVSGQASTHFLVKKLRGDTKPEFRPIIDEYAPIFYAAKDIPPILLLVGDRKLEYKNRVEENELFAASLRNLGHSFTEFYEMEGLDHLSIAGGAWILIPPFVKKVCENIK